MDVNYAGRYADSDSWDDEDDDKAYFEDLDGEELEDDDSIPSDFSEDKLDDFLVDKGFKHRAPRPHEQRSGLARKKQKPSRSSSSLPPRYVAVSRGPPSSSSSSRGSVQGRDPRDVAREITKALRWKEFFESKAEQLART